MPPRMRHVSFLVISSSSSCDMKKTPLRLVTTGCHSWPCRQRNAVPAKSALFWKYIPRRSCRRTPRNRGRGRYILKSLRSGPPGSALARTPNSTPEPLSYLYPIRPLPSANAGGRAASFQVFESLGLCFGRLIFPSRRSAAIAQASGDGFPERNSLSNPRKSPCLAAATL